MIDDAINFLNDLPEEEMQGRGTVNERLGFWLSAALDDPNVCDEFKQDINDWFASQPQTDALKMVRDTLEMSLGELYAPEPVCTCHINPPCRDCVDYGSTREAIKWGNKALAALKELSK
jgi:hypothetical protein